MIGKYERCEAVPSIDAAKKIADDLEVSPDNLAGEGLMSGFDKKNLKRMQLYRYIPKVGQPFTTDYLTPTRSMTVHTWHDNSLLQANIAFTSQYAYKEWTVKTNLRKK